MARRSIRRRFIGGGLGVAMVLLIGAGVGSTVLAAGHTVDISGFSFSPQSITVAVGDTVTWANADAQGHTATADGGAFDTGTIGGNASKSVTLTTAGTFAYHCSIHSTMTAKLVVAAATPPATDAQLASATKSDVDAGGLVVLAAIGGLVLAGRRFRGDSSGGRGDSPGVSTRDVSSG